MKIKNLIVTGSALALLATSFAHANTAAVGTTQTESSSILSKLGASYYGLFLGPSMDGPSAFQPTSNGEDGGRVELYNILKGSYKIDSKASAYVSARWNLRPSPAGTTKGFQMLDPRVGISLSNILSRGGFNMNLGMYGQIGATEASQNNKMIVAPSIVPAVSYTLGRWSLSNETLVRSYIYGEAGTSGLATLVDSITSAAYQISPRLSTSLAYELVAAQSRDESVYTGLVSTRENNLSANVAYEVIASKLTLAPYVKAFVFNPGNKLSMDNSQLGFEVIGTIF